MVRASQPSALCVEAVGGSGPVAQACSSVYVYVVCLSLGTPPWPNVCSVNPYQTSKRAMDLLSIELNHTMNAKVCVRVYVGGAECRCVCHSKRVYAYVHVCLCA